MTATSKQVLFLGDSYTSAEGIDPILGWPTLLRKSYFAKFYPVVTFETIAKTTWTSNELLDQLGAVKDHKRYDWISLCIGVNNQYRGLSIHDFERDLHRFAKWMIQHRINEHATILWLSIPDWSASIFAQRIETKSVSQEIDQHNTLIQSIAKANNFYYLNWTPLTRKFTNQPDAFAKDQLHPSPIQHKAWAKFIEENCIPIL